MLCGNTLVKRWIVMTKNRCYSELCMLSTFEGRFDYLRLEGGVGRATFGFDRYINQEFYTSREWKDVRNAVIVRDEGCDLGIPGYEIHTELLIHHMNPMSVDDIVNREDWILDPEYLILTMYRTHNDIHFGKRSWLPKVVTERKPHDTKLW
jgi:hypothetical protein